MTFCSEQKQTISSTRVIRSNLQKTAAGRKKNS
jgi:hypothetical protein